MSFSAIVLLVLLGVLVFGSKKAVEVSKQLGRALPEFKRANSNFQFQLQQEIKNGETPSPVSNGVSNGSLKGEDTSSLLPGESNLRIYETYAIFRNAFFSRAGASLRERRGLQMHNRTGPYRTKKK